MTIKTDTIARCVEMLSKHIDSTKTDAQRVAFSAQLEKIVEALESKDDDFFWTPGTGAIAPVTVLRAIRPLIEG